MRSQRSELAQLGLAGTAAPAAACQLPVLRQVTGDAPGDWFGYAVSRAGDVDQDGVPDFMVGAHQNLNGGPSPNPGYARVYSGLDGHVILYLLGDGTMWTDVPDDHSRRFQFGYRDIPAGMSGSNRTDALSASFLP